MTQILNQFSSPDPTVPLILGLIDLRTHSFLPFLFPSLWSLSRPEGPSVPFLMVFYISFPLGYKVPSTGVTHKQYLFHCAFQGELALPEDAVKIPPVP